MGNVETQISRYTDEELMALVIQRNTKALKVLYDRYSGGVFNFTMRYTNNREISEDVLQETFTRVWFAAHTFNPDRGAFKSWLFTIGINISRNEMTKKRYDFQYVDLDELIVDDETIAKSEKEPAFDILEKTEIEDTISKALERLNPYLREIVILKHYHKLKFAEIAEITNTPVGTLKARFHNALAQLRKLLEKAEF